MSDWKSKLVGKLSGTIGKFQEPKYTVDMAKANAEADVIKAVTDIEIAELKQ